MKHERGEIVSIYLYENTNSIYCFGAKYFLKKNSGISFQFPSRLRNEIYLGGLFNVSLSVLTFIQFLLMIAKLLIKVWEYLEYLVYLFFSTHIQNTYHILLNFVFYSTYLQFFNQTVFFFLFFL